MIKSQDYRGRVHYGTLSDFTADTARKYKRGDILFISDTAQIRFAKGGQTFAQIGSVSTESMKQATVIAALGATANLTAIGANFADLAAARTAVNTLATETEARLDAVEAKVDALLAVLKTAKLMANA